MSSSGSWANKALSQTATGKFRVTYDATPSADNVNEVSGLSSGAAQAFTSLATAVRFNSGGTIDVRNGSGFTAATSVSYSGGATYHFIFDVNVSTYTYSAYVIIGSTQITLGSNVAFRSEQSTVSSLNNVALLGTVGTISVCNIALSAPPVITTQPLSLTLAAGQYATFSVAATGTAPLTYKWRQNGTTISGATSSTYTTPAIVSSDSGSQFTVTINNSVGTAISNAATLTVGSTSKSQLGASATSLNFGSVGVDSIKYQNITLTNNGTSSITISKVLVAGAGFNASGSAAGLTLPRGETTTIAASFAPSATGTYSGSITVSNTSNSSLLTIALSGTGVLASGHTVSLSWSAASGIGYDVYVGSTSGGPYSRITSSPQSGTSYVDSNVQSGKTYYYVVTTVSSSNAESKYSSEVKAAVP